MTNTNKLKGRICEMGYTLTGFADAVGISRPALRNKINGFIDFRASEIYRIIKLLQIDEHDIAAYFFS